MTESAFTYLQEKVCDTPHWTADQCVTHVCLTHSDETKLLLITHALAQQSIRTEQAQRSVFLHYGMVV